MAAYLLRRSLQSIITFLVFLTLVFFLVQAQPGDFTSFYVLDPKVTPESREAIRESFGLAKPVWQQYLIYVKNFFRGDFGVSFTQYPKPVLSVLVERLPRTALLFVTATVVSFYAGFALGKVIAWSRGKAVEYISTVGGVYLYTIFTPWLALVLIWLFAFRLGWFPVSKFIDPDLWVNATVDANLVFNLLILTAGVLLATVGLATFLLRLRQGRWRWPQSDALLLVVGLGFLGFIVLAWGLSGIGHLALDIVGHMVLPVLTLTLISFAGTMLLTRASMLETLREDYVLAARAKGLSERAVRDRHAARNALLPVVTSFVFSLAFAIDGSVIIETIFSWPGMGLTLVQSVQSEDLPLAVGAFVFTGLLALFAHLVADLLYLFLDPRVQRR